MCVVSTQGDVGPAGPPGLPGSVVSGPALRGWDHGVGLIQSGRGRAPVSEDKAEPSDSTSWYKAFSTENGGKSEGSQTLLHCSVPCAHPQGSREADC